MRIVMMMTGQEVARCTLYKAGSKAQRHPLMTTLSKIHLGPVMIMMIIMLMIIIIHYRLCRINSEQENSFWKAA